MALTERQELVQYFVGKKIKFNTNVDMAIYLKSDQQRSNPALIKQKPYVDKVLAAGYKSKMAQSLFDDINKGTDENPVDGSIDSE